MSGQENNLYTSSSRFSRGANRRNINRRREDRTAESLSRQSNETVSGSVRDLPTTASTTTVSSGRYQRNSRRNNAVSIPLDQSTQAEAHTTNTNATSTINTSRQRDAARRNQAVRVDSNPQEQNAIQKAREAAAERVDEILPDPTNNQAKDFTASPIRDELDKMRQHGELDFLAAADIEGDDLTNALVYSRLVRGVSGDAVFTNIAEDLNKEQKEAIFTKVRLTFQAQHKEITDHGALLEYLAGQDDLGTMNHIAFGAIHSKLEAALAKRLGIETNAADPRGMRPRLDNLKAQGVLDFLGAAGVKADEKANALIYSRVVRGFSGASVFKGVAEHLNEAEQEAVLDKLKSLFLEQDRDLTAKGAALEYLAGKEEINTLRNPMSGSVHKELEAAFSDQVVEKVSGTSSSELRSHLDRLKNNGDLDFLGAAKVPSSDLTNAVLYSRVIRGISGDHVFDGLVNHALTRADKEAVMDKLRAIFTQHDAALTKTGAVLEYLVGKNELGTLETPHSSPIHRELEGALALRNQG